MKEQYCWSEANSSSDTMSSSDVENPKKLMLPNGIDRRRTPKDVHLVVEVPCHEGDWLYLAVAAIFFSFFGAVAILSFLTMLSADELPAEGACRKGALRALVFARSALVHSIMGVLSSFAYMISIVMMAMHGKHKYKIFDTGECFNFSVEVMFLMVGVAQLGLGYMGELYVGGLGILEPADFMTCETEAPDLYSHLWVLSLAEHWMLAFILVGLVRNVLP